MIATRWFSLRRRLLGLLLGGLAVAWLLTMLFSHLDAHHEVDELFDAQLAQAAQTLLALASADQGSGVEDLGHSAHKYQRRLRFQIWSQEGRLLIRSNNAPETPLTAAEGFAETLDDAGHWRHFSQWNSDHTLQVQVSEDHQVRDELIDHIAWRLALPALLGLPLIGFWVWLATRHGLRSLGDIASQIASRRPQQLQPLTPISAPGEIRPMLDALNDLFRRVESALESERRFTADAAHELRTPLAALLAQLQVAQRARDEDERERSLQQLHGGLLRASHLVEQMLQLARLDPESALPSPERTDLAKLAETVCAELGSGILDKEIDFELQTEPACEVIGQREWLRVLLRNLVDNALRYTPKNGQIRISVRRDGNNILAEVSDSGPGIPPAQRDKVLNRFYRLAPAAQPGSGLGLAIVTRIAELHATALELADSPPGGLAARIRLPAAPQASD